MLVLFQDAEVAVAEDILVADFEGQTYGEWQVEGTAFGEGPARGTLKGQMQVSGYNGEGLVNTFLGGDGSTGRLTSPGFRVSRKYIKFLIGGGGYAGKTCMQLMIDGQLVREAVGPNTVSGGSERLEPSYWDVAEFAGREAKIVIIDEATGGWGHINVDDIVQSDSKPSSGPQEKSLLVDEDYLLIPIRNGAPRCKLDVSIAGKVVRRYETELATDPSQVDWYAFLTLTEYRGKRATIQATRGTEEGFKLIRTASEVPAVAANYDEPLRPQLHFSQLVGWNNDPNGMTYLDGEWHLFFQHNPVGWSWGNMTWGHAVSRDLVHWKQLPNCLFPETMARGACFSGGGLVDKANTAGWKSGETDVLVVFLTDTGAGESVAYSHDRGRSFTWYEGNPVVRHKGRDPKVIWFAYDKSDEPLNDRARTLGGHWVMAVYDEDDTVGRNTAFHTSVDLKSWELQSKLPGYYECPELFELTVEQAPGETRWVTFAADGEYALGKFDGKTFTPDHSGKHRLHYGNFYASQTFENSPDGRRIQIGWMNGVEFKGEAFNQAFSIPHVLTLHRTPEGLRLRAAAVKELESLRTRSHAVKNQMLSASETYRLPVSGELFDVIATFEAGDATAVGLDLGGNRVTYDVAAQKWNGAQTKPVDGRVQVRVLLDRSLIEIWGNDGEVVISGARGKRGSLDNVGAFAEGGTAKLLELEVHELKSIWRE